MKKILIVLIVAIMIISIKDENNIVIPDDAIRFRIIANSNSKDDQLIKFEIASEVTNNVFKKYQNTNNKTESINQIKNSIPEIETLLNKFNVKYDINYGSNYFPTKTYRGIEYDSGIYESLVITLGEGKGENFWCVLFPPLCLLESRNQNTDDVEYRSLVKDILDRF